MKAAALTSAALLAMVLVTAAPADDVDSGLSPGDRAGAFNVLDCTGPNAGRSLCYR